MADALATELEERYGFAFSSLDRELFDGAEVTKGDLVTYLEAMSEQLVRELNGRPLSVIRARPGSAPFMQKNLPASAPAWIPSHGQWSQASQREVRYPLVEEPRTLLWLGNQRAVEFHPARWRVGQSDCDELVLDLDPPASGDVAADFARAAAAAELVHRALDVHGLTAQVKTSGAKGVHVVVPLQPTPYDDVAAATRALAGQAAALDEDLATVEYVKDQRGNRVFVDATRVGGATLACAWSPRARPGLPVSYPLTWDTLGDARPGDFTISTVPGLVGQTDPWLSGRPAPQPLPADLVAEGHTIPVARVAAMHEGLRRKRARAAKPDPRADEN